MSKYIRRLRKIAGYSFSVILPKEIVEKYGWKEKQKLVVTDRGNGRVEIRDLRGK